MNRSLAPKALLLAALLCGAAAAQGASVAVPDRLPVFESALEEPPSRDAFGFDPDDNSPHDATLRLALASADADAVVEAPPSIARVGVPEPAGWGSLLAGLGLLGVLRRRRAG